MSSQFKGPGLISGLGDKGDDAPPLATAAASAATGGGGGGEGGGMKTSGAGGIGTSPSAQLHLGLQCTGTRLRAAAT